MRLGFAALILASIVAQPPDVERDARKIDEALIAPCCFSQQVSVHQSPAADQVRRDVRDRLRAGQTREQILDAYVARYGPQILAQPPAKGIGRSLYVLPVLLLVASGGVVILAIRWFTRRPASPLDNTPPLTNEAQAARLDDELRDLD